VLLDPDGPAGPNSLKFQVVTLDGVAPGAMSAGALGGGASASPPPPPGATGQVLVASYPGAVLVGGAGADTLTASQGPDQLTGGAGGDSFVFRALPWNAGHIADFTPGSDVLDLRALFSAAGYGGSDPIADGYLSLVSDGAGGTRVLFDSDGRGGGNPWPITVTTLDHVSPTSIHASDWLVH